MLKNTDYNERKKNSENNNNREKLWRTFGVLWAIGTQFAVIVVTSIFIGQYLDNRFQTSPLFLIILVLAGLTGGMLTLYRILKKFKNSNEYKTG